MRIFWWNRCKANNHHRTLALLKQVEDKIETLDEVLDSFTIVAHAVRGRFSRGIEKHILFIFFIGTKGFTVEKNILLARTINDWNFILIGNLQWQISNEN